MADVNQTQPLDPLSLIAAQLAELTREMRSLPHVIARLDALTETMQQLQVMLREQQAEVRARDEQLRARDDAQQAMIQDERLRISEILAAVSGISNVVQDLRSDYQRRIGVVERQVQAAIDGVSVQNANVRQLTTRVDTLAVHQDDPEFRKRLEACATEFVQMRPTLAQAAALVTEFAAYRPWLQAIKWAVGIAGAIVVTVIVGAILWAVLQSGGGKLP